MEFRREDRCGRARLRYGFHLPLKGISADPGRFIDIAQDDRCDAADPALSGAAGPPHDGRGLAAQSAAEPGRISEIVAAEGLRLAWRRNHDFEYRPLARRHAADRSRCSRRRARGRLRNRLRLACGGGDPSSELERWKDRLYAIQVKDTAPPGTTAEGGWTAMGDGVVDWAGFALAVVSRNAGQTISSSSMTSGSDWRRGGSSAPTTISSSSARRAEPLPPLAPSRKIRHARLLAASRLSGLQGQRSQGTSLDFYEKLAFREFLRLTEADGQNAVDRLSPKHQRDELHLELFPGGDGSFKVPGFEHTGAGVNHLTA